MSETVCDCGRPTRDAAYVCEDCLGDLTRVLAEVPWLNAELETTISKQRGIDYSALGGSPSSETPTPVNVPAVEARRALRHALVMAVRFCEEEHIRHQSPSERRPADSLESMSRWLMWRVDGLAFSDMGYEFVREVTEAAKKCVRAIDRRPSQWFAGPCNAELPDGMCGRDMYAKPGSSEVKCRNCSATYDVKARRDWLLSAARDHLATASEIARAVIVLSEEAKSATSLVRLIGDWETAGRLSGRGHVIRRGQPRPTYRVGDVLDLVQAHMTRIQGKRVGA